MYHLTTSLSTIHVYNFSDQEGSSKVSYDRVRRGLQRIQSRNFPKNPENVEDILRAFSDEDFMENFGTSLEKEKHPFYRGAVETDEFSYCIFASEAIIKVIQTEIEVPVRKYLMDATFKVVPEGCFKQLLIIYIEYMEKVKMIEI